MTGVCKTASLCYFYQCGITISQGFVVTCEYAHLDFCICKKKKKKKFVGPGFTSSGPSGSSNVKCTAGAGRHPGHLCALGPWWSRGPVSCQWPCGLEGRGPRWRGSASAPQGTCEGGVRPSRTDTVGPQQEGGCRGDLCGARAVL